MKHLMWGIVDITIGLLVLLGNLLRPSPYLPAFIYGGIFLSYGIYRINKYRMNRKNTITSPMS
jgi:hypothetical protein